MVDKSDMLDAATLFEAAREEGRQAGLMEAILQVAYALDDTADDNETVTPEVATFAKMIADRLSAISGDRHE